MALSHHEVVARNEALLIHALVTQDFAVIRKLCHPDIVFTNEVGKMVPGIENLIVLKPNLLKYESIEILETDIRFFDTVAIVNSREKRTGTYIGLSFCTEYYLIRVWKFGRTWKLIASAIMMPC